MPDLTRFFRVCREEMDAELRVRRCAAEGRRLFDGGCGAAWRAERRRAIRRACLREVGRGARWAAAGCAAIAAGLLFAWLCTRGSVAGL